MIPQRGWMIIERDVSPKSQIVLPGNTETTSDEIFRVLQVNDFEVDHLKIKKGDVVALAGYIHQISYKGEKVILARQKDVVLVLNGK